MEGLLLEWHRTNKRVYRQHNHGEGLRENHRQTSKGREMGKGTGYLSKKTKRFMHIILIIFATTTKFNSLQQRLSDIPRRSSPSTLFVGDIILDPSTWINF